MPVLMERHAGWKRTLLGLLLLGLPLAGLGCGGLGLGVGAGAPDLTPPPPPNHNGDAYWGHVNGQVEFDTGFLHNEFLAFASPRANPQAPTAALVRDRSFYEKLKARLEGKNGKLGTNVGPEGLFDFGRVRIGTWKLVIVDHDRPIFSTDVVVESRSRQQVHVRVMGQDLADVDGDGDRQELLIQKEVRYKGDQLEYTRTYPPGGDVRTQIPGGTLEILGPDGYVKVIRPDGQVEYRYDPGNDFVDLDRDPTVPNRKKARVVKSPPPDKDRLLKSLTGRGRSPIILSFAINAYGSETTELAPGTLARLTVKADACGGSPLTGVELVSVSATGQVRHLVPRDDGSARDLVPDWPGFQSSLDDVAGDGVYSLAIPIDPQNYAFMRANHLIARARNEEDKVSRPSSLSIYLAPARPHKPSVGLVGLIRGTRLIGSPSPQYRAECLVSETGDRSLSALLLGPGKFQRILFPDGRGGLEPGTQLYASTPVDISPKSPYFLVVADDGGGVYYTRLRPE